MVLDATYISTYGTISNFSPPIPPFFEFLSSVVDNNHLVMGMIFIREYKTQKRLNPTMGKPCLKENDTVEKAKKNAERFQTLCL